MILVDTNVLSELTKPRPNQAVVSWLAANEPVLALPTIVLAELGYGVARLPGGKRKSSLEAFLQQVRQQFAGRTFAFDVPAAAAYGPIVANAERFGRTVKVGDGQIAAIADSRRMSIATRDLDDFAPCGVSLINPWTAQGD